MTDAVLLAAMVVAFSALVTAHVVLVFSLTFAHRPRWRGPLAIVLPPLGPIWGWRAGRKKSAIVWCVGLALYVVARLVDWIR